MTNKSVEHLLQEKRSFSPPPSFSKHAHISTSTQYAELYRYSIQDSNKFWLEQSATLEWISKPSHACKYNWDSEKKNVKHTWFEDGKINVSVNCLDRHLKINSNKTAIIWQGDKPNEERHLTYSELYNEVCKFSNALRKMGIKKGDRICIYMPMVPELAIAMLACARIGAIHSIVFGGFSGEALMHRINDSTCRLLITADCGMRAGQKIELKKIADSIIDKTPSIEKVIVLKRGDGHCHMDKKDIWYHDLIKNEAEESPAETMDAEDPLFILYTSGSTGKPKGVVHTQAGYLLYTSLTHKYVFDIHDNDIYWCTADIGWVTGHSYVIYGPLANGATTVMFEGVPTYPDAGRFWEIVDKFKVTIFYTAPTAIRALIRHGTSWPEKYNLNSLRLLGTVGEPINPEAWIWYYENIGHKKCPIVDTWWQTETGGIMITPLPGADNIKPGSASKPFFGIEPVILRDDGSECSVNEGGNLCIKKPWPGIMRTTWGDHQRFIETYFSSFKNFYFTGDGCRVDEDGDYWLLGRIDDVVNVSGHRIGTAEVESALVSHPGIAEAAVVPIPHDIKGQALYAFVTLVDNVAQNSQLIDELKIHVRKEIGPIATPEEIHFAKALPKTRSGKIMRRILRKIAEKNIHDLGDTSTLADPSVVDSLVKDRKISK